jgi:3-methyladenine DNA glycosylase Tag
MVREETEHHAPKQITPKTPGDYLEAMSRPVFQTGMSWKVVDAKWPGTREAFKGFDINKVARMGDPDIDQLATDTRVIRNRRKIEAVVVNANRIIALEREYGSFRKYLRSHDDFESLVKDLRKQFKFLGDMGAYLFLYTVREKVPSWEEWCHRDAPARARRH